MNDYLKKLALMTEEEKNLLRDFIFQLPKKSVVVEIGTFLGGSASIIASANSNIMLHSFDNYDDRHDRHKPNIDLLLKDILDGNSRTIESVSNILKDFKNIKLYKGKSPYDFYNWNLDIDVYFEDGYHRNPVLKDNVNFWKKFIKPKGYIIFHDYRPFLEKDHPSRFDDVIQIVEELSSSFQKINSVDGLLILQKQ